MNEIHIILFSAVKAHSLPSITHSSINPYVLERVNNITGLSLKIGSYSENSYLNDESYSLKDERFVIYSIYIVNKERNIERYVSIGDSFGICETIKSINYDFNKKRVTSITYSIDDKNFNCEIELFIEQYLSKKSIKMSEIKENKENKDFTIPEIKYVLGKILEEPEIDDAIKEFIDYKVQNSGIKKEELIEKVKPKKERVGVIVELLNSDICNWVNRNTRSDLMVEPNGFGVVPKMPNAMSSYCELRNILKPLKMGYKYLTEEEFYEEFGHEFLGKPQKAESF